MNDKLRVKRDVDGRLIPDDSEQVLFKEMQDKMREDFKATNKLFYSDGVAGMLTDQLKVYDYNWC